MLQALGCIEINMSAHFCQGKLQIAFVFSVPGAIEAKNGMPVSGETGTNLNSALDILHRELTDTFSSTSRYDYRITNAYMYPIAKSLGHPDSEASDDMVLEPTNVERVVKDLAGCYTVVLCGNKAQLLAAKVTQQARKVICVPHIGNSGLNTSYRLPDEIAADTPGGRRAQRIEKWACEIICKLSSDDAA